MQPARLTVVLVLFNPCIRRACSICILIRGLSYPAIAHRDYPPSDSTLPTPCYNTGTVDVPVCHHLVRISISIWSTDAEAYIYTSCDSYDLGHENEHANEQHP